jgi:formate hydrogenlyase subunit 3/multisubunit Na+/H+ antiporter MnhD subunit
MSLILILWCVAVLLLAACVGVGMSRARTASQSVYGLSLLASIAALAIALSHLIADTARAPAITLPLGIPWLGAHFRMDMLATIFLVVVNLGAAAASLFAIGYGRHEDVPERVLPFYPAFLAGMNLVVLADDAFTFLLSWEFMSLSSWALVMAHHRERDNVYAAYVYLAMASFGTLALLLTFGMLAGPDGGYAFADIRAHHPSAGTAAVVLILAIVGAGSKAGLVPLHVWLPLAHPAAPSHVSALMSGVMTKVAVYGFVRIAFDLLGPPAWWWSMLVLAFGGITAVMGVLYALMQHDLKRLLAYHTVENIGIIFIGLGLALAFAAHGMLSAAALGLTAGLLHVFNHSVFKSLLFFGAGAVLTSTGERDMEHLGGLIHHLRIAAVQRLRIRVADLSGDLAQPAIAVVGPEAPDSGDRCFARAFRRACRCVFREGFWHHVSWPAADSCGRTGARDRPLLARGDVCLRCDMPYCRRAARIFHRCLGACGPEPRWRAHAGADRDRVALDRADCREPQLLQRHSCLYLRHNFGKPCGLRYPSSGVGQIAAGAALGLRRS